LSHRFNQGVASNAYIDDVSLYEVANFTHVSGIDGYFYSCTAGTPPTPPGPMNLEDNKVECSFSDDSSNNLYIYPVDKEGNWGPMSSYGPFQVDTTPPVIGQAEISEGSTFFSGSDYYYKGAIKLRATQSDSLSGLASCNYTTNNGANWNVGSFNATHCFTGTISPGATITINFRASDAAGNIATGTARTYTYDNTPPSCSISSITHASPYAYIGGGMNLIMYYNTAAAGSFTVNAGSVDAGSGVSNVTFPTTTSAGGADTSSPYSWDYTWTTGSSFSGVSTVNCYDYLGNSGDTEFEMVRDITPPSGGRINYTDRYYTTLNVNMTFNVGTDTGAGINTSKTRLLRRNATLSNDACSSWTGWTQVGSLNPSSPYNDTNVVSGRCYEYRLEVFDFVHNSVNYTSGSTAKVSTSAPICTVASISANTSLGFVNGTTIFYSSAGIGSYNLTITATDTIAGIRNVTFPAITGMSGSGADTTSPYRSGDVGAYLWTVSSTYSGLGNATCFANSGLSTITYYNLTRDVTAPTTTINDTNSAWRTTDLSFSLSCTDGGSGCNNTYYKSMSGDVSCTAGGFSTYTTPVAVTCGSGTCTYSICYYSKDRVNNTESINKQLYQINKEAPTCSISSLQINSSFGYVSGTTLYYSSAGTGNFNVSVTASSGVGIRNVTFPAISTLTGSGADTTSPYSSRDVGAYFWTTGSTYSGTGTVTCYDTLGMYSEDTYTITRDITAPSGGRLNYTDRYYTTLNVNMTFDVGTDTGSGINASKTRLLRRNATLSNNACSSWTGWTQVGSLNPSSPYNDTNVVSGRCYEYRLEVFDNVHNSVNYTSGSTAKVSTSAPVCTVASIDENSIYGHVSGTTIYYNSAGAGSFNVTITATDSTAGIHNVTFPAISTLTGSGADTTSPYRSQDVSAYSWTVSSTYSAAASATCFANSGLSSQAAYTITRDITAPSGGRLNYTDGYYTTLNVNMTFDVGTDTGAGINTSKTRLLRRNATLSNNACSSWTGWTQVGSLNPTSPYNDTNVVSGRCYEYRLEVFDNVHNSVNYTSGSTAKVSTASPVCTIASIDENSAYGHVSGTTIYYNSAAGGSFNVTVTATDTVAGIRNVTFPVISTLTGSGGDATSPYRSQDVGAYSWTTGSTYSGPGNATCFANSGLSSLASYTITRDITPPSGGRVEYPNATITITALRINLSAGTDSGSGLASSQLQRRSAALTGAACGSYGSWANVGSQTPASTHYDDTVALGNCYQYRYQVWDNVLNGVNFTSTNTTIANNLAQVTSLAILPLTPNPSQNLQCNATVRDAENRTLTVEYWWYNNSILHSGGNTTGVQNNTNTIISQLGFGNTTTGETWNCTIRVFDGLSYSGFNSTTTTIQNNPPQVTAISLSPALPNTTTDLRCNATVTDIESTTLTVFWYWYNNSVLALSGSTAGVPRDVNTLITTLGRGNTTRGETWNCTIRAYDGSDYSGFNSTTTIIQNIIPNITVPTFTPVNPNSLSNIQCNATPTDAENATLTVEYWWYNNSVLHSYGNRTGLTNGTNAVITTLGFGNTTNGETWNCTVRSFDGTNRSAFRSAAVLISSTITPISPANAMIVDRDSVSAEPDFANLIARVSNGEAGITITFRANLTMPSITGETNIILGTSVTNATGHANLTWSGKDNTGEKMYAGNYTWWPEATGYTLNETRFIYLYGGYLMDFKYTSAHPNETYRESEGAEIHVVIDSLGPETRTQINATYVARVNATLKDPEGTNHTIELIDPGEDEPPRRGSTAQTITIADTETYDITDAETYEIADTQENANNFISWLFGIFKGEGS
jgi:hypothetical protein